jgi:hemolysin-activating ACP:hemolysin acyltransferase
MSRLNLLTLIYNLKINTNQTWAPVGHNKMNVKLIVRKYFCKKEKSKLLKQ